MTVMISQELLAHPLWTQLTVDNINAAIIVGPPNSFEIFIGVTAPDIEDAGMPVGGLFSWSTFAANEAIFARPFGSYLSSRTVLSGMVGTPDP